MMRPTSNPLIEAVRITVGAGSPVRLRDDYIGHARAIGDLEPSMLATGDRL